MILRSEKRLLTRILGSEVSGEMSQMLRDLRVPRSLRCPQVSKENPYSESQFKTLKYHPTFPDQFDSFEEAWES